MAALMTLYIICPFDSSQGAKEADTDSLKPLCRPRFSVRLLFSLAPVPAALGFFSSNLKPTLPPFSKTKKAENGRLSLIGDKGG